MNRFRRQPDERGAILVLSVAGIVVAMIAAGLAIDLGRLAQEGRENQKIADLAALDASRVLPGSAAAIQAAAEASSDKNKFPRTTTGYSITAVEGSKTGNSCVSQSGIGKVCVTVKSPFSNVLPYGPGGTTVTRVAVAGQNGAEAEFSVGSSLATLDTQESFIDPVLGDWLNTSTSLSAVSYNGLASGNVTLSALQQQLLAMGYSVGSVNGLMNTDIKVVDLLTATSQALGTGQPTAKAEVDRILAATVDASLSMKLRDFINVETPGSTSALDTAVNVFNLVNGSAQAANGDSFVSVPGLSVTVPLLSTLAVKLKVIEPAQVARGPIGTTAKNSQVQLGVDFDLSVAGVVGLVHVSLVYANAANAVATLTNACPTTNPASVTIGAQTSALGVSGSATTVLAGTLTITPTVASASSAGSHTFGYPTDFGTAWRTGVSQLGIDNSVNVTGSGILGNAAALLVKPVLNLTLPLLDAALGAVLKPVLQSLGLELAAADVTAIAMYQPPPFCGSAGSPGLLG